MGGGGGGDMCDIILHKKKNPVAIKFYLLIVAFRKRTLKYERTD